MPGTPTLWIISGPSSAGKSHLLGSTRLHELTSLGPEAPVVFPNQLGPGDELTEDSSLHYNLLRPAWRAINRGRDDSFYDFASDPKWQAALALPARRRALTLVAGKQTLVARAGRRTLNELDGERPYKSEEWISLYERIDLDGLYAAWREELDRQGIPWIELDSEAEELAELGRSG